VVGGRITSILAIVAAAGEDGRECLTAMPLRTAETDRRQTDAAASRAPERAR
jgi:hypothetical protein